MQVWKMKKPKYLHEYIWLEQTLFLKLVHMGSQVNHKIQLFWVKEVWLVPIGHPNRMDFIHVSDFHAESRPLSLYTEPTTPPLRLIRLL